MREKLHLFSVFFSHFFSFFLHGIMWLLCYNLSLSTHVCARLHGVCPRAYVKQHLAAAQFPGSFDSTTFWKWGVRIIPFWMDKNSYLQIILNEVLFFHVEFYELMSKVDELNSRLTSRNRATVISTRGKQVTAFEVTSIQEAL